MSKITPEAEVLELRTVATALTAERDDLRATVEKLTVGAADELTAVKADVVTKEARISELSAALEASASEVTTLKALIADMEASKVTASKQAADIVASTGVEPAKMEQPSAQAPAKTVEEIRAEYAAMPPSASRIAFLNANRSAILFGRVK
jgi:septal ring factor EnvC (AmiA/AmiB activator)